jgi:hypothetical protein
MSSFPLLIASVTAAATFGLIDTFNFVFVEDSLSAVWKSLGATQQQTIDILNAGVSSAISIMIAVFVDDLLRRYVEVKRTAFLDATGVIVGTILALAILKLTRILYTDRTWIKQTLISLVYGRQA